MASTILKFIRPDIFPIIDIRAYRAIFGVKLYSSQYSIEKYINYVEEVYKIRDLLNIDLQLIKKCENDWRLQYKNKNNKL